MPKKLGWKILASGDYKLPYPCLSEEEESLVLSIASEYERQAATSAIAGEKDAALRINSILLSYCKEHSIELDSQQKKYLPKTALAHTFGMLFLNALLADPNIEEIAMTGVGEPVFVYLRNIGWRQTNAAIDDASLAIDTINKMGRRMGRRLTLANPKINAALPDGSRLHASTSPISQTEFTIRKFRSNPISVPELASLKTITPEALGFLWLVLQSDISAIVAGNTASGKTTTLNALFSFIPLQERVVIIEETPEIEIPHVHKVMLCSNAELGIGMEDLVHDSLRMRPDRVIVGEIRTQKETSAFMEAVLAGQARGTYATFHANNSGECLRRLVMLGISEADMPAISIVIVQRRSLLYDRIRRKVSERRAIVEISEVGKDCKPLLLFAQDAKTGGLRATGNKSATLSYAAQSMGLTIREATAEIRKRSALISSLSKKKMGFAKSVLILQEFAYGKGGGNGT